MRPSDQFARSIAANVAYWRTKTRLPVEEKVLVLDNDRHNLFRAAEYGLALPETWLEATELVLDCYELILYRGYCQEWIPLLEQVLEECPEDRLDIQIRLYDQMGNLYRTERHFKVAMARHASEEKLANALEDEGHLARAISNQSKVYYHLRQYDDAETRALTAIRYYRTQEDASEGYASILNLLGLISQSKGDLVESQTWFKQSIEIFRQTNLSIELVRVLTNLAIVLEAAGKQSQALDYYKEAEKLLEPTNYEVEKSNVALSVGTLNFHKGDLAKAEAHYRQAYSPWMRDFGPLYQQAMIANNLGNVYHAQGRLSEAELWLGKSIIAFREADAHLMLANSQATLARTFADQGKGDRIGPLVEEAMGIVLKYPDDAFAESIRGELAGLDE